jgi:hypothetical protein
MRFAKWRARTARERSLARAGCLRYHPRMRARSAIAALLIAGCHVEDTPALDDSIAQLNPIPECEHPVEVIESGRTLLRAHRSIASLSAMCSPGTPRVCKQMLLRRACELKADALVIDKHAGSGGQWQDPAYTLKPMSAHAIRWTEDKGPVFLRLDP